MVTRGNEDAMVGLHGPGVLHRHTLCPLVKGNHIQLSSAEEEEEERVSPTHTAASRRRRLADQTTTPLLSEFHMTFGGGL